MARNAEFAWVETDSRIIQWYYKITNQISGQFLDPTGTIDTYRLQNRTPLFGGEAPQVEFTLTTELLEDLEFDVSSEFSSAEDSVPFASNLTQLGRYSSLLGGVSPEILNIFKVPTWQSTAPISISLMPVLYTRTHSILDVLIPAMSLTGLTVLKFDKRTNSFRTPGVYMGNLGTAIKRQQEKEKNSNSSPAQKTPGKEASTAASGGDLPSRQSLIDRLASADEGGAATATPGFFSLRIPNLINLPTALLLQCKPKFAKQITESGGPLWAILEMKIQSALPASTVELFSETDFTPPEVETTQAAGRILFS